MVHTYGKRKEYMNKLKFGSIYVYIGYKRDRRSIYVSIIYNVYITYPTWLEHRTRTLS